MKADSTQKCSQVVPHPSTNWALRRLTSEVRRDPVHSTRYGRQRQSGRHKCGPAHLHADPLRHPHSAARACAVCAQSGVPAKLLRGHDSSWGMHTKLGCAPAAPASHTKADSTLRSSRAVPHPSTNRALRRLTSEVRRDPVHSARYGRQRWLSRSQHHKRPHGFTGLIEGGAQGVVQPYATMRWPLLGGAGAFRPLVVWCGRVGHQRRRRDRGRRMCCAQS